MLKKSLKLAILEQNEKCHKIPGILWHFGEGVQALRAKRIPPFLFSLECKDHDDVVGEYFKIKQDSTCEELIDEFSGDVCDNYIDNWFKVKDLCCISCQKSNPSQILHFSK